MAISNLGKYAIVKFKNIQGSWIVFSPCQWWVCTFCFIGFVTSIQFCCRIFGIVNVAKPLSGHPYLRRGAVVIQSQTVGTVVVPRPRKNSGSCRGRERPETHSCIRGLDDNSPPTYAPPTARTDCRRTAAPAGGRHTNKWLWRSLKTKYHSVIIVDRMGQGDLGK